MITIVLLGRHFCSTTFIVLVLSCIELKQSIYYIIVKLLIPVSLMVCCFSLFWIIINVILLDLDRWSDSMKQTERQKKKYQVSVTSITQEICETCGVYARFKTISVKFWAPLFEPFQLIQKYNKHIISWGKPQCQDWLAIQAHQKISLPAFFTLCLSWYSCMFNHQISYEVPI